MRRLALAALVAACGTSASPPEPPPEPLVFERYSPPQFTSQDVFLAARGDTVVLARRISRDGGATWAPSPIAGAERVEIHGATLATYVPDRGLVRYDLARDQLAPVADAPPFASPRTWRITPAGRLVVFDAIRNAIAFEAATGWQQTTLPQHSPTEHDPYIRDVESNGTVALVVSAWGLHRSRDGGATWERLAAAAATHGRELVALADGRFALLGGARTYRFTRDGALVDDVAGVASQTEEARACDDGALVVGGRVSRDGGQTWQPLVEGGDLTFTVERVGCGGGRYWVIGHSAAWGYRLLRYDVVGGDGVAVGNWELAGTPAWSDAGPALVRTGDGTFLAAGLAWRDLAPAWTLQLTPARTWAAGDALFGVADDRFLTSSDGGRTWRATPATGLPGTDVEAFARSPVDGALHIARFTGESTAAGDRWHAQVWRSTDGGTSWAIAYDAVATRVPGEDIRGEVHRFVGIAGDGAWIATDAISVDGGVTWQPTEYEGDRSLAFLTPDGYLVTPREDVWRVYEAGGTGALRGTWALEADGRPLPASQLRSVAFDEAGHAYVARGAPYVQLWRSTRPLVR